MYIPGFGSCSSIIHLIAKHPLLTLGIGLLAASAYLNPTLGTHSNPAKTLQLQEADIAKTFPELTLQLPQINMDFKEVLSEVGYAPLTNAVIQNVLDTCGECKNITPEMVRSDERLLRDVAYLYFLDLCRNYGPAMARVYYAGHL